MTGFSRLAVYGDGVDDITGVVYRKDLDMGRIDAEEFSLRRFMRPPAFIPETVSARQALKQMQSTRVHFVFVINEHGGTEGILTLEDLLEEIVGEIDDEFDEETKSQIKRDHESFLRTECWRFAPQISNFIYRCRNVTVIRPSLDFLCPKRDAFLVLGTRSNTRVERFVSKRPLAGAFSAFALCRQIIKDINPQIVSWDTTSLHKCSFLWSLQ